MFVYGSENITNQAFWLGYSEMFSHYEWFLEYVRNLEQVTTEKLLVKAREYLSPQRRVLGIYHPEENPA
jgi:zinc protease